MRPCTCLAGGHDYLIGETACIRGRIAVCDRVLNNTSWTFTKTPCPVSMVAPRPRAGE